MDYEQGLEQLKQRLHSTKWEDEFLVYELRLRDNLYNERLYGSNEQIRSDRARIIEQLNRLAQRVKTNFNNLCLSHRMPPSAPFSNQERERRDKLRKRLKDIENA